MPWNSISPDGGKSCAFNVPKMAENTAYIKTAQNIDHYWDVSNLEGHHKWAQMTQVGTSGSPANPTPGTGIDMVYYCKSKTSTESPSQQDIQPFVISDFATQRVMQLLGIRAMGVFSVSGNQVTMNYSHNLKVQDNIVPTAASGVYRSSTGKYTITFNTALPSANYLILGGMLRNNGFGDFYINTAASLPPVKTTTFFKFTTISSGGDPQLFDPVQCWFVVFGG